MTPEMKKKRKTADRKRSGVALVVVLGLLALLMITVVAFTIMMRIERAGASNLCHAAAARHMARGALAYAVAAIDRDIGDAIYPPWSNRIVRVRNGTVRRDLRLPQDVFVSIDESVYASNRAVHARVLSEQAARYVPRALLPYLEMTADTAGREIAPPEWIPVRDEHGSIVGRYAFTVLNTSGLLDANIVHHPSSNRWLGATPAEIRLHPDTQLDVIDADKFTTLRRQQGRYDALPELADLNEGLEGDKLANFEIFSYAPPDNIPRDPAIPGLRKIHDNVRDEVGKHKKVEYKKKHGKILIGPAEGESRSAYEERLESKEMRDIVTNAFMACGLRTDVWIDKGLDQATCAYLALRDYIDEDDEPAGADSREKFGRPASEAVPMLSQWCLGYVYSNRLETAAEEGGEQMVTHYFEWQYQFAFVCPDVNGPSGSGYKADITFYLEPADPASPWNAILPRPDEPVEHFNQPLGSGRYAQVTYPDPAVTIAALKYSVTRPLGEQPKLDFGVIAAVRVRNGDDKAVDQVPFYWDDPPKGLALNQEMVLKVDNPKVLESDIFWMEALDPRLNGYGADENYWFPSSILKELAGDADFPDYEPVYEPADLPSLAKYALSRRPIVLKNNFLMVVDGVRGGDADRSHCDPPERQMLSYTANRPIQSAGELGYLPIGAWLTINLYDHGHETYHHEHSVYKNNTLPADPGFHPVLDYFMARPAATRGRVNLNSRNTEALAAVFNDLPLRTEGGNDARVPSAEQPGQWDDSYDLARWLQEIPARRNPRTGRPFGLYERLSDLGRLYHRPETSRLGAQSGTPADESPVFLLHQATVATGRFGEFEREALIRNACELLTLRQQTFTIIIRADAFAPHFGQQGVDKGNVLATAHAVAQVWRDAETHVGADGKEFHPCFVQLFKFLHD